MISVLFAEAVELKPVDDASAQSVLNCCYREQGAPGRALRVDHNQRMNA